MKRKGASKLGRGEVGRVLPNLRLLCQLGLPAQPTHELWALRSIPVGSRRSPFQVGFEDRSTKAVVRCGQARPRQTGSAVGPVDQHRRFSNRPSPGSRPARSSGPICRDSGLEQVLAAILDRPGLAGRCRTLHRSRQPQAGSRGRGLGWQGCDQLFAHRIYGTGTWGPRYLQRSVRGF